MKRLLILLYFTINIQRTLQTPLTLKRSFKNLLINTPTSSYSGDSKVIFIGKHSIEKTSVIAIIKENYEKIEQIGSKFEWDNFMGLCYIGEGVLLIGGVKGSHIIKKVDDANPYFKKEISFFENDFAFSIQIMPLTTHAIYINFTSDKNASNFIKYDFANLQSQNSKKLVQKESVHKILLAKDRKTVYFGGDSEFLSLIDVTNSENYQKEFFLTKDEKIFSLDNIHQNWNLVTGTLKGKILLIDPLTPSTKNEFLAWTAQTITSVKNYPGSDYVLACSSDSKEINIYDLNSGISVSKNKIFSEIFTFSLVVGNFVAMESKKGNIDLYNLNIIYCTDSQYHKSLDSCGNCDPYCATCYGPGPDKCDNCRADAFFLLGNCVKECISPFILKKGQTCIEECPKNYFRELNFCIKCSPSCEGCFGPKSSNCQVCNSGFYKKIFLNTEKRFECVKECGTQHYLDQNSQNCLPCHKMCDGCTGEGNKKCKNCQPLHDFVQGACIKLCSSSEYRYADNDCKRCADSIPNCHKCTSEPKCFNCFSSHPLFEDDICVKKCLEKNYAYKGKCLPRENLLEGTGLDPFDNNSTKSCDLGGCKSCILDYMNCNEVTFSEKFEEFIEFIGKLGFYFIMGLALIFAPFIPSISCFCIRYVSWICFPLFFGTDIGPINKRWLKNFNKTVFGMISNILFYKQHDFKKEVAISERSYSDPYFFNQVGGNILWIIFWIIFATIMSIFNSKKNPFCMKEYKGMQKAENILENKKKGKTRLKNGKVAPDAKSARLRDNKEVIADQSDNMEILDSSKSKFILIRKIHRKKN